MIETDSESQDKVMVPLEAKSTFTMSLTLTISFTVVLQRAISPQLRLDYKRALYHHL